tara:strand:- start:452 stop:757 length:306 start_codon:yes stop_codon:yes gene_type:complete
MLDVLSSDNNDTSSNRKFGALFFLQYSFTPMRAEQVTVQQPAAVGAAVLVLCASVREHLLGDWLPVDVLDYDIAGFPESVGNFHSFLSLLQPACLQHSLLQ